jgi:alpha-ribazole phosphatase
VIDMGVLPLGCTFRLILLRHGEPVPEANGRCYGRLDVGLSETGRTQIQKKLKLLRSLSPQAIYSSPRKRAVESACIAGEYLRLQPQITSALSEIDFGAFEGLT